MNEINIPNNSILLEEMRANFKAVMEHTSGIEERMIQRMDRIQARNEERFDTIESVLRYHSKLHEENAERWKENDLRWQKNDEQWQRTEERLARIDDRLTRVESKLDHINFQVERHERELRPLR